MELIPFSKLAGSGNDFIIIDNRELIVPEEWKGPLATAVCDRRHSVGADGVLLLEQAPGAHFAMRLFNPDGNEGEMCGNGARCIAQYAYTKGIAPAAMRMSTIAGIVEGLITPMGVRIRLWRLDSIRPEKIALEVAGQALEAYYIEVGVPHAVVFQPGVDRASDATVRRLGREIRFHPAFPKGTNVNFVSVTSLKDLIIRTYERGVEEETLACGTGCVASSLVSHQLFGVESPVRLQARGGTLQVQFEKTPAGWDISLEGAVRHIMDGQLLPQSWLWKEVASFSQG